MSKVDQTAQFSGQSDGAAPLPGALVDAGRRDQDAQDQSLQGRDAEGRDIQSQNTQGRDTQGQDWQGQDRQVQDLRGHGAAALGGNASTILVALAAAILEAALVAAAYHYNLALHWIVLLHCLVVGALADWVRRLGRQDRDASHALLLLLGTLAVGPLGAMGAAIAAACSSLGREDQHLLKSWYDRISHSTRVEEVAQHCDMVAVGRTMDLRAGSPRSFSNVLQNGSLVAKQNALGLIARRFHPDYLPALQAALKSDLPVIRVQAAAVAAHVRVELKDLLHRLIAEARLEPPSNRTTSDSSNDARSAFLLAARIERCTTSGLLDEKDRLAGVAARETLYDRGLQQLDAKGSAGSALAALLSADEAPLAAQDPVGADDRDAGSDVMLGQATGRDDGNSFQRQQENAELRRLYEALLLRRGRYGAFRALREDLPALRPSLWTIRPWPRPRVPVHDRPGSGGARS